MFDWQTSYLSYGKALCEQFNYFSADTVANNRNKLTIIRFNRMGYSCLKDLPESIIYYFQEKHD